MSDYHYLCLSCGAISPFGEWTLLKYDDEGELIPIEPGDGDPICVCPVCRWQHEDTDDNPGIFDGTRLEVARYRREIADDYLDLWSDRDRV